MSLSLSRPVRVLGERQCGASPEPSLGRYRYPTGLTAPVFAAGRYADSPLPVALARPGASLFPVSQFPDDRLFPSSSEETDFDAGEPLPETPPPARRSIKKRFVSRIKKLFGKKENAPQPVPQRQRRFKFQKMATQTEYTTRTLDQEIDALEIIPDHPDFVIVGTYNLRKQDTASENSDDETATAAKSLRAGSLQILPFVADYATQNPEMRVQYDRKDFPCAIVDLHFHPGDRSLLGVATSTGEIQLYRVIGKLADTGKSLQFRIMSLGGVVISGPDNLDMLPLITYFTWLPQILTSRESDIDQFKALLLSACDSSGYSKVARIKCPMVEPTAEPEQGTDEVEHLNSTHNAQCHTMDVHTTEHNLEAWYVTTIPIQQPANGRSTYVLLSGGDDSVLRGTEFDLSDPGHLTVCDQQIFASLPVRHFRDSKTHTAGVIAIYPFEPHSIPLSFQADPDDISEGGIPLLTGSYDDHIRLFIMTRSTTSYRREPTTYSERAPFKLTPNLIVELKLDGSPWRIIPISRYTMASADLATTHHYTFLICCMYAGAKIVRVTYSPLPLTSSLKTTGAEPASKMTAGLAMATDAGTTSTDPNNTSSGKDSIGGTWTIKEEFRFTRGHESMVYAGAIRPSPSPYLQPGTITNLNQDHQNEKNNNTTANNNNKESKDIHKQAAITTKWQIMTTSFYDRKVCVWEWEDPVARSWAGNLEKR